MSNGDRQDGKADRPPEPAFSGRSEGDPDSSDAVWRRLDRRAPAVTAVLVAGIAFGATVPFFVSFRDDGKPLWSVVPIVLGVIAVLVGMAAIAERVRWRYTRYRVTEERVEVRFSWVVQRLRSVPRDRIRTVDLTANPLLRLFGVVKAQIGTGQQTGDKAHLVLNPLDRRVAEELRAELLEHMSAAGTSTREATSGTARIAQLNWSWIRYAPISITTPIIGAAAFGALLQVSEWLGLQRTVIGRAGQILRNWPLTVTVLVIIGIGVVVGVLGSLALFVELWRDYRLTREGDLLRVRRGLLTTRSLSLDERRLRGVEVVEPLGARLVGAARVDAVASGLRSQRHDERSDPRTLLPAAPRELAHDVAAQIVREPVSPTRAVRLRPHPKAARGRRLRWAVGAVLSLVAVLAVLGVLLTDVLLHIAWVSAVVLLPIAVALALDAYRNLGHGLTGDYLVSRHGTISRHTVALQRAGVIGWNITSSPFQRRVGLLTLNATTAANKGAYPIYDIGEAEGLAFADEAVPDLLTPFLERG